MSKQAWAVAIIGGTIATVVGGLILDQILAKRTLQEPHKQETQTDVSLKKSTDAKSCECTWVASPPLFGFGGSYSARGESIGNADKKARQLCEQGERSSGAFGGICQRAECHC